MLTGVPARTTMLALLLASGACTIQAQVREDAFIALADAYAERDAAAATAVYSADAEVMYAYDGAPESRHTGHAAIEQSFASLFDQVDPALPLDLSFRLLARRGLTASGIYRLRFGNAETSYGRFEVEQNGDGLFTRDRSTSATRRDFEEAAGPLLVRPNDSDLDRGYYTLLTGRYRLPDGCSVVITRSVVRLFARNTCDNSWRGLDRINGLEWTAGDTVLAQRVSTTYQFARIDDKPSSSVTISAGGEAVTAQRSTPYTLQAVTFLSMDNTRLAGTLYLPSGRPERTPATVLVHGSGPQDRDGYASIIAVLADALAAEGRAVLTYDKRGSGASEGNGDSAGFDTLAWDARAAMAYLAGHPAIDRHRIGLAGSSQAGWVVARTIASGAQPYDVFLLGAAGAAFTVREQNLYNTEVRMACAGISARLRRIALDQQAAFFDALADRSKSDRLDALTREGAIHTAIRDWLFPDSAGLDREDAWFTVLDPTFDPLPVWRGYSGAVTFVFSEFDDSTDTASAIDRLRNIGQPAITLANAQHLGLDAGSECDGELAARTAFSPLLFELLATFGKRGFLVEP